MVNLKELTAAWAAEPAESVPAVLERMGRYTALPPKIEP